MAEQERFTEFVHPLIAVSIPACFLFTQVGFFSRWIPSWPVQPLVALLLAVVVGILTVLLGNLFHKERLGFAARLRELIIVTLVLYLAASLVSLLGPGTRAGSPIISSGSASGADSPAASPLLWFPALLRPSLLNITVTSLGLLQWIFSVLIQGALRDRELLLAEIESAQGLELQYRLRDTGTLAEDTLWGFRKILTMGRILVSIIVVETALHGFLYPEQGLISQIFVLPLLFLYPLMTGLIGRYKREQYDAGAGIAPDKDSRSHQVRTIVMLLLGTFILAFLGAGTSSLLPIQWILAFFAWLSGLMPKRPPLPPQVPEPMPQMPDMEALKRDLEALEPAAGSSPDLTFLWLILGIFSAVVAGLFILFFLVSPLKSRYFWEKVRKIFSPRHILQGLRRLLSYFKPQKAAPIEGLDLDPDNLKQVRDQLERLTAEKKDRRKQAQLGKMVDRYIRFLRWGESMKVPCRPSMAPGEYAETLSPRFPELAEPIHCISTIFEAALYGDTLITREQWNQFNTAIERVIHSTKN
ncbi:DUF4129 domain-containing protein [Gracilinema caldarium]|uniref:Protein-glutamine gamma-glutamyltransferase-like C-terminal domain-containing protein n=1 Tax=Gracilinema caldarium (strain ATCC 51460 / DSM 7334 / H1) TaxID=744872 RepID=F8F396_GRAC1|nr:DUF4129 domain-containing protein [Gracilinema caldarium]AEJ20422.1 hypothetical protein Spica_2311 [Gracilinema caldarium DSM 7334]